VDVDHIIPLDQGGAPFAFENTKPMCKSCHGRKTRTE
jgi:5-methylcytosine-specific restriction endonuclease McrA